MGDWNTLNHQFQERVPRTFPNKGPGSVNLTLIKKQSLPKEVLAQERCLKKCREGLGNMKPACMNSMMAPGSALPSLLPCFSHSLSFFQPPKQRSVPSIPEVLLNPATHPLNYRMSWFPSQPNPLSFFLEVIVFTLLSLRRVLPSLWTFPAKTFVQGSKFHWFLPIRK